MANVVLKSDFRDGDLLFAQQLNNNFKAIQKALETMNSIIWQDNAEMVVTFRGTTEEINERDIIDGQILYDVLTGETYIDYDGKRISTGSGNAIHIGEDAPTNPSTQIWITSDEAGNMLSEVVNSLEGNITNKAPSVAVINKMNTYSTEKEVFTGKYWVDGKKIYRKVVTFTGASSVVKNIEHNISNISKITGLSGIATASSGYVVSLNMIGTKNMYTNNTLLYRVNNTQIQIQTTNDDYIDYVFDIIIEYTKTNDAVEESEG